MPSDVIVRIRSPRGSVDLPGTVDAVGPAASSAFEERKSAPGIHLLAVAVSDSDYAISLSAPVPGDSLAALREGEGKAVLIVFPGHSPVRRRLRAVAVSNVEVVPDPGVASQAAPIDLNSGREGAAPLWLLPAGVFSASPTLGPDGPAARDALVTAARWISSRRTSTLPQLFPPSAFHPEEPVRKERLSARRGAALLDQARAALEIAAVGGEEARRDPTAAATLRSAATTILSHLIATSLDDRGFAPVAERAAEEILALIEEGGGRRGGPAGAARARDPPAPAARPGAHGGPAGASAGARPRAAPRGAAVRRAHGTVEPRDVRRLGVPRGRVRHPRVDPRLQGDRPPPEAPPSPNGWSPYRAFEAPFKTPAGEPIRVFARAATPRDENLEMGMAFFIGVLINRHAQLGAFSTSRGRGAGETGRVQADDELAVRGAHHALCRLPDVPGRGHLLFVGLDVFQDRIGRGGHRVRGGRPASSPRCARMSKRASHAELDARLRKAQWPYPQAQIAGFSQFVGPSHPLVVARFSDVNRDGRADYYDGFLDFQLADIAEDIEASMTPRDPG